MSKHFIGKVYDFDPRNFEACKATFNNVLRQLEEANAEIPRIASALSVARSALIAIVDYKAREDWPTDDDLEEVRTIAMCALTDITETPSPTTEGSEDRGT